MSNPWFIEVKKIIDTVLTDKTEQERFSLYEAISLVVAPAISGNNNSTEEVISSEPKEVPMPDSIRNMVEAGITVAQNPPKENPRIKITEEKLV